MMPNNHPEPDPEMPAGYDQPHPPTDAELAETKAALAEPAANVDDKGTAHFCVIPPDRDEYCGGCGQSWPCDDAVRLLVLNPPEV